MFTNSKRLEQPTTQDAEEASESGTGRRRGVLARDSVKSSKSGSCVNRDSRVVDEGNNDQSAKWRPKALDEDSGPNSDTELGEESALLSGTHTQREQILKETVTPKANSPTAATLLLLKSFTGTGILFLPRAYLHGGMLFSNVVLVVVAALSYYCFVLLIKTRAKIEASYGDLGGIIYGPWMRALIYSSIVLSQIGLVSAYIIFTAENIQAFVLVVSKHNTWVDIKVMIFAQLIVFLPLSLIRDLSKLGLPTLIGNTFMIFTLIFLGYFNISNIYHNGISDITSFNAHDWPLFLGTIIFTFEGISLVLPIQESMKQPSKFSIVLPTVMIIITTLFITVGTLSYAVFGSQTKTIILLNLPQDNRLVNTVQLLYSLAIFLSAPLQLFPAVQILEDSIFSHSGKNHPSVKWAKNGLRSLIVMVCTLMAWGGSGALDKFVALVGSFACVPLVYVYPVSLSPSMSRIVNLWVVLVHRS